MKCMTLKCILKCITNNCKLPQNLDFPETEPSFRFIWFEKFPWVYNSRLMGGWSLSSVLFGDKNRSFSLNYFSENHIEHG